MSRELSIAILVYCTQITQKIGRFGGPIKSKGVKPPKKTGDRWVRWVDIPYTIVATDPTRPPEAPLATGFVVALKGSATQAPFLEPVVD